MFEIKELFYEHAGYIERQNHASGYLFMCTFLYKAIHNLEYTCTHQVHRVLNPRTQQPECAHRVHVAPLISNTVNTYIYISPIKQATGLDIYPYSTRNCVRSKYQTRQLSGRVTVLRKFISWWGGVMVMGRSKRA